MASFRFSTYSKALRSQTTVNCILPEIPKTAEGSGLLQTPFKTLWLLHGLNGNEDSWMQNSAIERYARERNLAVIMPDGGRSWYTDTQDHINYLTFVAEELPAVCRSFFKGLSDRREDNLVIGLSMGGYGALKCALTYPDRYAFAASLSGALDITRKGRTYDLDEWRRIFGFTLSSAEELENTKHDLFHLARENKKEGKPFPKLFLWCGTEDPLIVTNRNFRDLLTELSVPHDYRESEGTHNWKWWDKHVCDALSSLLDS